MPLWATILTTCGATITATITLLRFWGDVATKTDIRDLESRLGERIERINDRIDKHLEGHP